MMKLLVLMGFMGSMVFFNSMIMFYVNLCYLLSMVVFLSFLFMWLSGGSEKVLLSGYFSCDKYSILMFMLSSWIIGLMFMSLYSEALSDSFFLKKIVFLVMLSILFAFFMSYNFMGLYFFFEISLIPTYFLILYWGSDYERVEASFYLFIYMMFISFPLLMYLMKMYDLNHSLNMNVMSVMGMNKFMYLMGTWEYLVVFGAFFIKLPIYMFHVWLPKAHSEAPVYGSMLLAAVLLKLGGYGLLRVMWMFGEGCKNYSSKMISIGLVGAVYIGVLCIIQVDLKSLVAYSSVVHMNFMLASFFTMSKIGFMGGIIAMVSHGLCSSGLFYMVNIYYSRSLSRLMILNKGLIGVLPSLMFWWFLLCVSNFSFPFSLNFMSEVFMIMALLSWDYSSIILISLVCFFSSVYSLYLFSLVFHGSMNLSWENSGSGYLMEHLVSFVHYMPLLLIMLNLCLFE